MQKLVLIHHGAHDPETGKLLKAGVAKIHKLGSQLVQLHLPQPYILLSSDLPRAMASSNILSEILCVKVTTSMQLRPNNITLTGLARILGLIKANEAEAETIFLVSHAGVPKKFGEYFRQQMQAENRASFAETLPGQALLIDCLAGKAVLIDNI